MPGFGKLNGARNAQALNEQEQKRKNEKESKKQSEEPIQESSAQIAALGHQISEIQVTVDRFFSELSELRRTIETLDLQNQTPNTDAAASIQNLCKDIQSQAMALRSSGTIIQSECQKLEGLSGTVQLMNASFSDWEDEIVEAIKCMSDTEKSFRVNSDSILKGIAQIQNQLNQTQTALDASKEAVDTARDKLSMAEEKILQVQKLLFASQKELDRILTQLKTTVTALNNTSKDLQEITQKIQTEMSNMQSALLQVQSDMLRYYDLLKKRLDGIEKKQNEQHNTLNDISKKISDLGSYRSLERKVEDLAQEFDTYRARHTYAVLVIMASVALLSFILILIMAVNFGRVIDLVSSNAAMVRFIPNIL